MTIRPRVPSFYALELPRAIAGGLPELEAFEREAREAAPARLNWPAPKEPAAAIDAAEYDLAVLAGGGSARHLMEVNAALGRSLRGHWKRWHAKWDRLGSVPSQGRNGPARELSPARAFPPYPVRSTGCLQGFHA